jgi:hypothetical protein
VEVIIRGITLEVGVTVEEPNGKTKRSALVVSRPSLD